MNDPLVVVSQDQDSEKKFLSDKSFDFFLSLAEKYFHVQNLYCPSFEIMIFSESWSSMFFSTTKKWFTRLSVIIPFYLTILWNESKSFPCHFWRWEAFQIIILGVFFLIHCRYGTVPYPFVRYERMQIFSSFCDRETCAFCADSF